MLAIEPAGEADVFDLTEDVTHHFVAGGLVVHNCSEYMFLDDTACNLASINLVKFLREDGSFDVEGFRHACRLWTLVLEISVLMARLPERRRSPRGAGTSAPSASATPTWAPCSCARASPTTRREAAAICGAITAIMSGEAYATSAEMARDLGPFPGYPKNREHMLRVMRNHRRAAYDAPPAEYEGLTITPLGIDPAHCPARAASRPRARPGTGRSRSARQHGYRNAQVTVLAPTGTIGLVMDCDTTGIEPDFALVKFKKLAGGGYFKIINQSLPAGAARRSATRRRRDRRHRGLLRRPRDARGRAVHQSRDARAPRASTTTGSRRSSGASIETAFDITFAFNAWTLGEDYVAPRLGLNEAQLAEWNGNLLRALGLHPGRDRGGQRLLLRHHDRRGRAAS